MKAAALFSCTLGIAGAFLTPVAVPRARGRNVRMNVDSLIGADVETTGVFDPLNFAENGSEDAIYNYRAIELKHGRVAMLAALGILVQSFFTLPDPVFANGARPQEAFRELVQQRPEAILQIIAAASLIEITVGRQDKSKEPGDLGFGSGFKPEDPQELAELQLKELKNGRLAMVAVTGALVQEALTGQGPIEQLLAGHISPFGDGQGAF